MKSGEWRLSCRWVSTPHWTTCVDRFPEGTVYRFWCAWLLVKVMVKA